MQEGAGKTKDWRLILLATLVTPFMLLNALAFPLVFFLAGMSSDSGTAKARTAAILVLVSPVASAALLGLSFVFGWRFRASRIAWIVFYIALYIGLVVAWFQAGPEKLVAAYMWPAWAIAEMLY